MEAGRDSILTLDCCDKELVVWLDGEFLCRSVLAEALTGSLGLYCSGNPGASFGHIQVGAPAWLPYFQFGREPTLPAGNRLMIASTLQTGTRGPRISFRNPTELDDAARNRIPLGDTRLRVVAPNGSVVHGRGWLPTADFQNVLIKLLREADGTGMFVVPRSTIGLGATMRLTLLYQRKLADSGAVVFTEVGVDPDEVVFLDLPPST